MRKEIAGLIVALSVWACTGTSGDGRSVDGALSPEERGRAIAMAFNVRSSIVADSARPAPCELYRTLDESPEYREFLDGLSDVGDLPPAERACDQGWSDRTARTMGEALWIVGRVGRSGDTVVVHASINRPDGHFHSERVFLGVQDTARTGSFTYRGLRVGRIGQGDMSVIDSVVE